MRVVCHKVSDIVGCQNSKCQLCVHLFKLSGMHAFSCPRARMHPQSSRALQGAAVCCSVATHPPNNMLLSQGGLWQQKGAPTSSFSSAVTCTQYSKQLLKYFGPKLISIKGCFFVWDQQQKNSKWEITSASERVFRQFLLLLHSLHKEFF